MALCSNGSPSGSLSSISSRRSASENTPAGLGFWGRSPWVTPIRNTTFGVVCRTCSAVPKMTWSAVSGISDTSSALSTSFKSR